ncbi:MAG: M2 family metallopeptidase [Deltaproteobacteria bacterium]|nr:M2 family metallopeptidase [Deltaproteobacteria bacterium]
MRIALTMGLSLGLGLLTACKHAPADAPAETDLEANGPVQPVTKTAAAAAPAPAAAPAKPSAEEAKTWAAKLNVDLKRLFAEQSRIEWVRNTYITHDTELLAAAKNEEVMAYQSKAIKEATRFDGVAMDPETARFLKLLKVSSTLPAPDNAEKRKRLATIASELDSTYGKGKYCKGKDGKDCRDLGQLSKVIAESRKYDELLDAWQGWHTISQPMRPLYQEYVQLANEGAKEIGFKDLGELWRSGYDMPPAQFEAETERLWGQVKPLYEALHCYVRGKLSKKYTPAKVPTEGLIPAHLLGNMWAQEWGNIYPLVEPFPGQSNIDVTAALKRAKYDPVGMVKLGEKFFTSLGLDPLPATFWERSMFVQPKDRDVVCHASAWDVTLNNDVRIKMCIKIDEEDLVTVHHELGHNYYYMYYYMLPALFQQGANDGFHEGIGDTLALSVTPGYLKQIGLLPAVQKNDKALINIQMKDALDKIAFLPFGKLIDQWRWKVYNGEIKPENYNAAWWELRRKYQGIDAPVARTEADFDPGAKYHIPANVPYTRYFLARILQFQFHRALCKTAGHTGPLHECSIYGSTAAGDKLKAMLALGASKPWPEALEAMTGQREMDASALIDYFDPLMKWLAEQNKGQKCGW